MSTAEIPGPLIVLAAIATPVIGYIVHQHRRRRDRADILEKSWSAQQQLNLAVLNSKELRVAYDVLVSGNYHDDDDINHQVVFLCFMLLNRVQLIWNGYTANLFHYHELRSETIPTIALICRNPKILNYCMTRGYDKEFQNYVCSSLQLAEKRAESVVDVATFLETRKPIG